MMTVILLVIYMQFAICYKFVELVDLFFLLYENTL